MSIKKYLFLGLMGVAIIGGYLVCHMSQAKDVPDYFIKIHSFSQAKETLASLKAGDVVFFDVDDTLLSSSDLWARQFNPPFWFKVAALARYPRALYDFSFGEAVFSKMLLKAPRFVVEPAVKELIKELRAKGVIVMVITGMETGSFGLISNMPAWRASMLEALGIQLEKSFKDTSFNNFPTHRKNFPGLYQGLLCCNQRPKGEVMAAFLKYAKLRPVTVVHFDDTVEELVSSKNALQSFGFEIKGFYYTRAAAITHPHWTVRRGLKQLVHLVEHDSWLPDEKVE